MNAVDHFFTVPQMLPIWYFFFGALTFFIVHTATLVGEHVYRRVRRRYLWAKHLRKDPATGAWVLGQVKEG